MKYETVIGLEVHVELSTSTKIFCGCANEFGGEPNMHCCPVCTGMPGVLPVMNEKVVEYAAKAGLALNCEIAQFSKMYRKGYYYPDLPKAYQISQFDLPICKNGSVEIEVEGKKKIIRITRIHMEEDAGKLLHEGYGMGTAVDYNRCGVPLIEIVTEPDIRSAEEARVFLETLKSILQYIDVSDCKMQEGSLRCDVNVSIRPMGQEAYGTRNEMKNINSFSSAVRAIEYESKRQIRAIEDGETIKQQTLRWDDNKGISYAMRGKEEAHDYRYFPDPDLVPIVLTAEQIEDLRKGLPELPAKKRARFVAELGLPEYDANILTSSKALAQFFEECVLLYAEPKKISNWIMGDLLRLLKGASEEPENMTLQPKLLVDTIRLVDKGVINAAVGKSVFEEVFKSGKDAESIVKEKGLMQINDDSEIRNAVGQIIQANMKDAIEYRNGNEKAFTFFVGQVMKKMKGKANPKTVNEVLKEELSKL
jgi:aspartyl-tRNA(Asn)/glutamyl-tRNA(Gln) amidotransferase subunit B